MTLWEEAIQRAHPRRISDSVPARLSDEGSLDPSCSGEALRRFRENSGLDEQRFAKAHGIAPWVIRRCEAGHGTNSFPVYLKLKLAYGDRYDAEIPVPDVRFVEPYHYDEYLGLCHVLPEAEAARELLRRYPRVALGYQGIVHG